MKVIAHFPVILSCLQGHYSFFLHLLQISKMLCLRALQKPVSTLEVWPCYIFFLVLLIFALIHRLLLLALRHAHFSIFASKLKYHKVLLWPFTSNQFHVLIDAVNPPQLL